MRLRIVVMLALVALLIAPAGARAADGWVWPVRGPLLTSYSNDNAKPYASGMHRGIDIGAAVGSAVGAATAGTVRYAGNLGSSGITVSISGDDGRYLTSYLHLSRASVAGGEHVAAGDPIGAVGTTGVRSVEAPHLHFGVRLADRGSFYVDPLSLLSPLGAVSAAPPATSAAPAVAPTQPKVAPAARATPAVRRQPVREPKAQRDRVPAGKARPRSVPAAHPARVPIARPNGARHARGETGEVQAPGLRPWPLRHPAIDSDRVVVPGFATVSTQVPWRMPTIVGLLALALVAPVRAGLRAAGKRRSPGDKRRPVPARVELCGSTDSI